MGNVFESLDPYLGGEIDSEALIRQLLDHDLPCEKWPDASIRSEIEPDVNILADTLLVVYDTGPATNLGYGRFRFPASLYVIGNDPDRGAEFKSWLYGKVMAWPWQDPPPKAGGVSDVQPTGFHRIGPDDWNLARDLHVWALEDCIVTAGIHEKQDQ